MGRPAVQADLELEAGSRLDTIILGDLLNDPRGEVRELCWDHAVPCLLEPHKPLGGALVLRPLRARFARPCRRGVNDGGAQGHERVIGNLNPSCLLKRRAEQRAAPDTREIDAILIENGVAAADGHCASPTLTIVLGHVNDEVA